MEVQPLSPEIIQDVDPVSPSSIPANQIDETFNNTAIDLISAPLGARILHHTDDFFASSSNLINPKPPIAKSGVFVETGAWYDGWETRRHNPSPPDHVTIRLGPASGIVQGVEIDTTFFTGNYGESISIVGAYEPEREGEGRKGEKGSEGIETAADRAVASPNYTGWTIPLLSRRALGPSQRHAWFVDLPGQGQKVTHVRLSMWPDGGIARFRLYGRAVPNWPHSSIMDKAEVELSAAVNGGVAVAASDQHYSRAGNLLLPGRGRNMGDGWETKRSRGVGHVDWVVVRLGTRGVIRRVMVDTMHFRGNFPRGVKVEALDVGEEAGGVKEVVVEADDERWVEIVGMQACDKDKEHEFLLEKEEGERSVKGRAFTHVKMVIEPDGGVKRFRVFGTRV